MRALSLLLFCLLPAGAFAYEGVVERPPQPEAAPQAPVLTRAPELVRFVEAPFPDQARQAGAEGEVGLLVDIAADGTVSHAEVVRPAGLGFDEAALAAVRQFVFTPAELDGVPAAVRIEYTYHFVLREAPAPAPGEGLPPPLGPVSLQGRVIERGSRTPIVGAMVRCAEHPEFALTGADGEFVLHAAPGPCSMEIDAGGYFALRRDEEIEQGKVLEVIYHLMPRSHGLFQSIVRGERDKREATRRTLERDELQKVPGTFGDPVRVIQNLPGVARTPFVGGQLIVRGAAPSETGTYMDGVEIPQLFHFMGGPSVVNAEFLDRLDFLPGGFGPRYGRAVGGIVDASTRRGDQERPHGSFKIDLIDSAAFFEAPVGGATTVAAAARRSYVDLLMPLVTPETENGTISVLPRYWDYQVRADHGTASDRNRFTVMAFGSDDRLSVAATGEQRERDLSLGMRISFHRLRFSWQWREGALSNTLTPYLGRDDVNLGVESGGASTLEADGGTWAGGVRDELAWEFGAGHKVRLGADLALNNTRVDMLIPPLSDYRHFPGASLQQAPEEVSTETNTFDFGLYNEWELRLFDRLIVMPGLRVDQFRLSRHYRASLDPRLNARFELDERTTLKGSAGHYSMPLDARSLDKDAGNPELRLPKAFQSSLGVEHRFTSVLEADLIGFFNRRYDLVVPSTRVEQLEDGTVRPERLNNDGLGRAYGLEVLLRHRPTPHFFGWLAYTLSRSETRERGESGYAVTQYDETHILAAVAQYRFGNGWGLSGRFRLVSGRPTTPVLGGIYDADADGYAAERGPVRSARDGLFHQLDLRVDKDWLFEGWKLGVYLDVQNVYWAKNVETVRWDYRFRDKAEIAGLPLLPTLGVKGSF